MSGEAPTPTPRPGPPDGPGADPSYSCRLCRRVEWVDRFARGFPPDAAKRRLKKACKADGCACEPVYWAGVLL